MVFKHGLIPLEIHSWLTANLAVTISRQKGFPPSVQRDSWLYGLYHDAGVLSLQEGFDHSSVSISEIRLLNELFIRSGLLESNLFPLKDEGSLVDFAHLHAQSHHSSKHRALREEMERKFGTDTVDAVIEADSLATGREKFGYERDYPIFHSFYDGFNYDAPDRRLSLACFLEHAKRQAKVEEIIHEVCRKIAEDIGIPRYDAIITRSSLGLEYHIAEADYKEVMKSYKEWIDVRSLKGDEVTFPGGVRLRIHREKPCFCILCGREARFYKGIRDTEETILKKKALKEEGVKGIETKIHMGKGDVRRVLGFELDTWRGMFSPDRRVPFQDHQRGLCDDCAMAIALNLNEMIKGLIILLPKEEDVFERYYDTICIRRLRWWAEKREEGLCHQDPRFEDLSYWKGTREYSEKLEGLDEHRARYERVLDVYRRTFEALGAIDRVVFAEAELSEETLRRLSETDFDLAPMAYGCIKDAGWSSIAVKGFALSKKSGIQALRILLYGADVKLGKGFTENLEEIRKNVRNLRIEDLDAIVEDYSKIVEAVST